MDGMFRILTTCYNAERFISRCLRSLQSQEETDWVCYVTDDLSTDKSTEIIKTEFSDDPRIRLIENKTKHYQVGNYIQVMNLDEIDDEDIVLTLDGDDWFPDRSVLSRVKEAYDLGAWMSYGQFLEVKSSPQGKSISHHCALGFAAPPVLFDELRQSRYTTTHLRTWKAFLWKNINPEDLKRSNGDPIKAGGDTAFMYPMLEMAGPYRAVYIPYINYMYNTGDADNVYKHSLEEQHETANEIRKRSPYKRLSR